MENSNENDSYDMSSNRDEPAYNIDGNQHYLMNVELEVSHTIIVGTDGETYISEAQNMDTNGKNDLNNGSNILDFVDPAVGAEGYHDKNRNLVLLKIPSILVSGQYGQFRGRLTSKQNILYIGDEVINIGRRPTEINYFLNLVKVREISRTHVRIYFQNKICFMIIIGKHSIFINNVKTNRSQNPIRLPQSCRIRFAKTSIALDFENLCILDENTNQTENEPINVQEGSLTRPTLNDTLDQDPIFENQNTDHILQLPYHVNTSTESPLSIENLISILSSNTPPLTDRITSPLAYYNTSPYDDHEIYKEFENFSSADNQTTNEMVEVESSSLSLPTETPPSDILGSSTEPKIIETSSPHAWTSSPFDPAVILMQSTSTSQLTRESNWCFGAESPDDDRTSVDVCIGQSSSPFADVSEIPSMGSSPFTENPQMGYGTESPDDDRTSVDVCIGQSSSPFADVSEIPSMGSSPFTENPQMGYGTESPDDDRTSVDVCIGQSSSPFADVSEIPSMGSSPFTENPQMDYEAETFALDLSLIKSSSSVPAVSKIPSASLGSSRLSEPLPVNRTLFQGVRDERSLSSNADLSGIPSTSLGPSRLRDALESPYGGRTLEGATHVSTNSFLLPSTSYDTSYRSICPPVIPLDEQRPPFTHPQLVVQAFVSLNATYLTLGEILDFISRTYKFYAKVPRFFWKKNIKYALTYNECFVSVKRPKSNPGPGGYWCLVGPDKPRLINEAFREQFMVRTSKNAKLNQFTFD